MTPPEVDYRVIPLTRGQVAYVSPRHFQSLMRWKWFAFWSHQGKCFYAARRGEGNRLLFMHQQILALDPIDTRDPDHRKSDRTLDNTDENLRPADKSEQSYNRRRRSDNSTGFKWVYPCNGKFRVTVAARGKRYHGGYFTDPEIAYGVACGIAKGLHGEFVHFG